MTFCVVVASYTLTPNTSGWAIAPGAALLVLADRRQPILDFLVVGFFADAIGVAFDRDAFVIEENEAFLRDGHELASGVMGVNFESHGTSEQ